jgi:hypothetical protein
MKIEFDTNNSAFDDWRRYDEISRILKKIEEKIMLGYDHGSILDINGNKIGEWSL